MEYLVKINRLGSKAVVFGMGLGDDKTTSFDIPVKDYISESSFPFPESSEINQTEAETSRALQDMFISVGRVTDLGALFKLNILQKLAPSIHKEGYEESAQTAGRSSASREGERQQPPDRGPQAPQYDPLRDDRFPPPARPHPFDDPLTVSPRRPDPAGDFPPPGFEDEYEINRPPRGGMGGRNPLNIGENDLYPPGLGPHDPLRPSFGPGGGLPRGGGGGGMHPTFDDPLFGGTGGVGGGYDSR